MSIIPTNRDTWACLLEQSFTHTPARLYTMSFVRLPFGFAVCELVRSTSPLVIARIAASVPSGFHHCMTAQQFVHTPCCCFDIFLRAIDHVLCLPLVMTSTQGCPMHALSRMFSVPLQVSIGMPRCERSRPSPPHKHSDRMKSEASSVHHSGDVIVRWYGGCNHFVICIVVFPMTFVAF